MPDKSVFEALLPEEVGKRFDVVHAKLQETQALHGAARVDSKKLWIKRYKDIIFKNLGKALLDFSLIDMFLI